MKKWVLIILIIFLVIVVSYLLIQQQYTNKANSQELNEITSDEETKVDFKASFAVFTNGTFRIFTSAMYHNLSEDVYIQSNNPNIVHVKLSGITWNDFFNSLPLKLSATCLTTGTGETFCNGSSGILRFFLNGIETSNLLNKEIVSGDKVLVTFGKESKTQIQNQLNKIPDIE